MTVYSNKRRAVIFTIRKLGLLGTIVLTSLFAAMQSRRWGGTRPYHWVFAFWTTVLGWTGSHRWLNRDIGSFERFVTYTGRDTDVTSQLAVNRYLAELISNRSQQTRFEQSIHRFFSDCHEDLFIVEGPVAPCPSILVTSHHYQTKLSGLRSFESQPVFFIGYKLRQGSASRLSTEEHGFAMARNIMRAVKMLKNGRRVGILGDGFHGDQPIWLPLCGVQRPFQKGFATLARQNQVPVVFMHSRLGEDGRVTITYSEPVHSDPDKSVDDDIAALLQWFAAHLEQVYQEYPETIMPGHVEKFLALATDDRAIPGGDLSWIRGDRT